MTTLEEMVTVCFGEEKQLTTQNESGKRSIQMEPGTAAEIEGAEESARPQKRQRRPTQVERGAKQKGTDGGTMIALDPSGLVIRNATMPSGRMVRFLRCQLCRSEVGETVVSRHIYQYHMKKDMIQCTYCPYSCTYQVESLKKHLARHHPDKEPKWIDHRQDQNVQESYLRYRSLCFPLIGRSLGPMKAKNCSRKGGGTSSANVQGGESVAQEAAMEMGARKRGGIRENATIQMAKVGTGMHTRRTTRCNQLESGLALLAAVAMSASQVTAGPISSSNVASSQGFMAAPVSSSMSEQLTPESVPVIVKPITNAVVHNNPVVIPVAPSAESHAWCQKCKIAVVREEVSAANLSELPNAYFVHLCLFIPIYFQCEDHISSVHLEGVFPYGCNACQSRFVSIEKMEGHWNREHCSQNTAFQVMQVNVNGVERAKFETMKADYFPEMVDEVT